MPKAKWLGCVHYILGDAIITASPQFFYRKPSLFLHAKYGCPQEMVIESHRLQQKIQAAKTDFTSTVAESITIQRDDQRRSTDRLSIKSMPNKVVKFMCHIFSYSAQKCVMTLT
ncbi:hypothetical protein AFK69_06880 [Xenorhabdus sp. GDc328]|nr:hypothetical protein AAY47_08655 [Xenorhabdus griffiniae]KOP34096.1 hypothetical protein AFK69_06880 [Xenorhabdus sp. GDc328]